MVVGIFHRYTWTALSVSVGAVVGAEISTCPAIIEASARYWKNPAYFQVLLLTTALTGALTGLAVRIGIAWAFNKSDRTRKRSAR